MALTKISRSLLDTGISDSSDATAITIDSSERVLIGGTSATFGTLGVESSSSCNIDFFSNSGSSTAAKTELFFSGGISGNDHVSLASIVAQQASGDEAARKGELQFLTANSGGPSTKMIINAAGNVGIGDSNPSSILDINANTPIVTIECGSSQDSKILFVENGSNAVSLFYEGSAGAGTSNNFHLRSELSGSETNLVTVGLDGNVGIAETSPSGKLEVNIGTCSQGAGVNVARSNTQAFEFFANSGANALYSKGNHGYFGTSTDHDLVFVTGGTERMRLDDSGKLLLGTTDDTIGTIGTLSRLGVVGGTNSTVPIAVIADTDTSVEAGCCILELSYNGDTAYSEAFYALFSDSTSTQGSISGTGNQTVAFNTSSDKRLKENIVNTESQLEKIKQIKVRDFNYIGNDKTTTGMIAQELNEIIPNVVLEGLEDYKKHPWSIDYGKLTPYLIKAIQEQQEQIEELKKEIETFKN